MKYARLEWSQMRSHGLECGRMDYNEVIWITMKVIMSHMDYNEVIWITMKVIMSHMDYNVVAWITMRSYGLQ